MRRAKHKRKALDDQVVLDIADDGRGFAPTEKSGSGVRDHGLPAMRTRVEQLGGTLTIESTPARARFSPP